MQIVNLKKVSNCTLTFLSTAGQTEISSGIFNILNKNSSLENFLIFLSIFFLIFEKEKIFTFQMDKLSRAKIMENSSWPATSSSL